MLVLFLIDSFASTAVKVQVGKNAPVRRIEETCAALGRMYIASKVPSLLLMLLFEYTANEILVPKQRHQFFLYMHTSSLFSFLIRNPKTFQLSRGPKSGKYEP